MFSDKEIHEQIVQIIQLYSKNIERKTGRQYMGWNPGNPSACKSWNHFARAAETIRRMEADPEQFIGVQFLTLGLPTPQQLSGAKAGYRYQQSRFFEHRQYHTGKADYQLTLEAQYTMPFVQSAKLLQAYLNLGLKKHEVYESAGLKLSSYFILSDPDQVSRILEKDPPEESWLRRAWWDLKENPALRQRLTALWRQVWTCEERKRSPGAQLTPWNPLPSSVRTRTSSDVTAVESSLSITEVLHSNLSAGPSLTGGKGTKYYRGKIP